jgi:alanine racemase
MSRQGIAASDLDPILDLLAVTPQLRLSGLMTHFASTEVAHSLQTLTQRAVFEQAVSAVTARALRPDWVHVGNSSYIDNDDRESSDDGTGWLPWLASVAHRAGARPMVRSGLALYGHLLPIEGASRPAIHALVRPVLAWKTRVLSITELPACNLVGYNGTYRATHPMRLALLPAGYADGLRRELSSTNDHPGGWVILHGHRAPIIGRISMNLTSVDITAIPGVSEGDVVTLLGEGITAEDHARLAHTTPYEILCGIRASCPTD